MGGKRKGGRMKKKKGEKEDLIKIGTWSRWPIQANGRSDTWERNRKFKGKTERLEDEQKFDPDRKSKAGLSLGYD